MASKKSKDLHWREDARQLGEDEKAGLGGGGEGRTLSAMAAFYGPGVGRMVSGIVMASSSIRGEC